MRQLSAIVLTVTLAGIVWVAWSMGLFAFLRSELIEAQRAFQSVLAGGVRALKAHEPGAALALVAIGFLYGLLHAAGPGHGKVVLGAWAFSTRARLAKVAVITLMASLAQSIVAIVLVLAGAWLFDMGRTELTALSDDALPKIGNWALVGLGLWLILRAGWSVRRLWTARPGTDERRAIPAAPGDDQPGGCGCGHAHAPAPEIAARASLPEALLLVAGIALRPCTGAVFVMLLTVLIGAPVIGALSVLAMGLGTALITLAIAMGSSSLGSRALAPGQARILQHASAFAQAVIGGIIVVLYI